MLNTKSSIFSAFRSVYHSRLLHVLTERVQRAEQFYERLNASVEDYRNWLSQSETNTSQMVLNKHQDLVNQLISLNNLHYNAPQAEDFDVWNVDFAMSRNNALEQIVEKLNDTQDERSFFKNEKDGIFIQLVKHSKRQLRAFQKLFKPKGAIVVWRREIPLRNYAFLHFGVLPLQDVWLVMEGVFETETNNLVVIKQKCAELESLFSVGISFPTKKEILTVLDSFTDLVHECRNKLNVYLSELPLKLNIVLDACEVRFEDEYYKLGTVEFRNRKIAPKTLEKRTKKIEIQQKKEFLDWESTLFTYSEDWSFDLDLFLVKSISMQAYNELERGDAVANKQRVLFNLDDVKDKIGIIRNTLLNSNVGAEDFRIKLDKFRADLDIVLNENGLKLNEGDNSKQNISAALGVLNTQIETAIQNISNTRMVLKHLVSNRNIRMKDLVEVHPRELLQFEILPKLQDHFELSKKKVVQLINAYEVNIIDIAHFVDYNFDSAKTIFEQSGASVEKAQKIPDEGLSLANEKLNRAIGDINAIFSYLLQSVQDGLVLFEKQLLDLTESEKVSALNLRLLKAKALNNTVLFKNKVFAYGDVLLKKAKIHSGWLLAKGTDVTEHLSKMYSIKEADGRVNAEISNFLAETRNAINKLPFIYQRLFKLDPVSKGYLFFRRKGELVTMRNAYHNWRLERYASLAIVGEKGSGVTSMVQHFFLDISYKQYTIEFKYVDEAFRPDVLVKSIAEVLHLEPCIDSNVLIDKIALFDKKVVVYVEGLQFIYLRKVDGFDSVKLLLEIMSRTNKQIFWVVSCTVHAWNYMDKVLKVSDFFGYHVELGEFSNDEMIEIVSKRHKVSGYDLHFLPSKYDLENKKYRKLSDEDKQQYLSREFYQQLNQLAKGNISIALIFWLSSTHDIKGNVLTMRSMRNFNSAFIKDLDQEKLFALHAILLHDGLRTIDFCKVMRYTPAMGQMKLLQMLDDGLLLKTGNKYVVNLLLYRATINALQSKNLLH